MILPGATLGILGGGQLGRMFTVAARRMGYRVVVLDPDPHSPAAEMADEHLRAHYHDAAALARMVRDCVAITTEFENVPADSLAWLAQHCTVYPAAASVAIVQDRIREKTFVRDHGFSTAPFVAIHRSDALGPALAQVGAPALLKISRMGYDGKGQTRVSSLAEAEAAFAQMGGEPCVLEAFLPLRQELSVIVARAADGQTTAWPVAENQHQNGILDISIVPARCPPALAAQVRDNAIAVLEALQYVGVAAVEFFLLADGTLCINEIAPRPHNSGHYTLDACVTDQFEQQVRVLCGLPLGDTRLLSPVVMANLLGELWGNSQPKWEALLQHPNIKLHLYGKREARPGRKMGHFNCLDASVDQALAQVQAIQKKIGTH